MKLVLSFSLTFVLLFSGCRAMEKTSASLSTADVALSASAPPASVSGSRESWNNGNQQGQAATAVSKPARAQDKTEEYRLLEPTVPAPTDRKIIRNGEFTIESKTPTEDQHKIQAIAESLGGFVVTSEFQQSSAYITKVNIIVRVPSAQFQAATDKIRGAGNQVLHRSEERRVGKECA